MQASRESAFGIGGGGLPIPSPAWKTGEDQPANRTENYGGFSVEWDWDNWDPEDIEGQGSEDPFNQDCRARIVSNSNSYQSQAFSEGYVTGDDGGQVYITQVASFTPQSLGINPAIKLTDSSAMVALAGALAVQLPSL